MRYTNTRLLLLLLLLLLQLLLLLGYESWSRVPRLPVGENRMILRFVVLSEYQRVTDTDGHAAYACVAL